jgi:holo-[acyl-carrier protein] synthase
VALTVGIDVVDVERIRKATVSGVPLTDVFTSSEIRECLTLARAHARLAACFAIKEAFLKASGLGLNSGLLFKEIEVVNLGSGAPELRFSKRLRELTRFADPAKCLVSSSYTRQLACAVVALQP